MPSKLELNQRKHRIADQLLAPLRSTQIHQASHLLNLASGHRDQLARRRDGAPASDQVVADHDVRTRLECIAVNLELIGAKVKIVFDLVGRGRQLPKLANGHQTDTEPESKRQRVFAK